MWVKQKLYSLLLIFSFVFILASLCLARNNFYPKNVEEELHSAEKKEGMEAISAYKQILENYPQDRKARAKAQLDIGLTYLGHLGDKNKAEEELKKVITSFPEERVEVIIATYWLATINEPFDLPKATEYYQIILDGTTPQEKIHSMACIGLAKSYVARNDFENAIQISHYFYTTYGLGAWEDLNVDLNLKLFYKDYSDLHNVDKIVKAYKKVLHKYPADQAECLAALFKTASTYERFLGSNKEVAQMRKFNEIYLSEEDSIKYSHTQADIHSNIGLALNLYELDNESYPTTAQGLKSLVEKPTTEPMSMNWNGPYIKMREFKDPWGNDYVYIYPGVHDKGKFDLFSKGKNGIGDGNDVDDITNWDNR